MLMDAFTGEIRAFANNYYPYGWLPCFGQRVAINDYAALFSIVGSYYGSTDMRTYFTLPDLRGRTLIGVGGNLMLSLGDKTGAAKVTLNSYDLPPHTHSFTGAWCGDKSSYLAAPESEGTSYLGNFGYNTGTNTTTPGYVEDEDNPVTLNPSTIAQTGGNSSHENMSPFLAINYYICWDGYYPQRPS